MFENDLINFDVWECWNEDVKVIVNSYYIEICGLLLKVKISK